MKVLIIGGVAGGATLAARLRRLDEAIEIIVFEKTGYVSYANCGLPYYINNEIERLEDLTLQTPESLKARYNIDVRVLSEVFYINSNEKYVSVKNYKTREVYSESYDALVIATGGKEIFSVPTFDNKDNIFSLRNVEDAIKLKIVMENVKPKSAIVLGGGFVGLEATEVLTQMGVRVSIIEKGSQVAAMFDPDTAKLIENEITSHGVELYCNSQILELQHKRKQIYVTLSDKKKLSADILVLATGVFPNSSLAEDCGLALGYKNGILTNSKMKTSEKDIYAVGDVVVFDEVENEKSIMLAGPANKQGRIAADTILGYSSSYQNGHTASILKLFDKTIARVGLKEIEIKNKGLDYDKVVLSPMSHASYYPMGSVMTIKVVFERNTEKILGAEIFGKDGVDKRIDVLATALHFNARASDLRNLSLAYAPPYASAKDPINMIGYMIENLTQERVKQFHHDEVSTILKEKAFFLDVRTPKEYEKGHIKGFVNIPIDELRGHLEKIPKKKKIYVMCQSGVRSYIAYRILSQNGYQCSHLAGGYRYYKEQTMNTNGKEKALPCGME